MIAELSTNALTILLAVLVFYFSIFFHELGHALMAWKGGYVVTSLGLGMGRPFLIANWRGTILYFCLRNPFQGFTWLLSPEIFAPRRAAIGMLLGGPLANLLLAAVFLPLAWLIPSHELFFWAMAAINAFLGITNLIPFRVKLGKSSVYWSSDGGQILQALRGRDAEVSMPMILSTFKALDKFWTEIGDRRIRHIFMLQASLAWLSLGDPEKAEQVREQAEAVPLDIPFHRAFAAMTRGCIAGTAGNLEAGAIALGEAEALFADLRNEAGLVLVAISQCELELRLGNRHEVETRLQAMLTRPMVMAHSVLRLAVREALLEVRAAAPGDLDIDALKACFDETRRVCPSPTSELRSYSILAACYREKGEWQRAEETYRAALRTVGQLLDEFQDAEDRERFRTRQQTLLADAAHCLKQLGKDEEAAQLDLALPTSEAAAQQKAEIAAQRNRTQVVTATLWHFANFAFGLALFAAGGLTPSLPSVVGAVLMAFSLLGFLCLAIVCLLRLIFTRLHVDGRLLLFLAFLPWTTSLALVVSTLFFDRFDDSFPPDFDAADDFFDPRE